MLSINTSVTKNYSGHEFQSFVLFAALTNMAF
jgi:hypothetical protein